MLIESLGHKLNRFSLQGWYKRSPTKSKTCKEVVETLCGFIPAEADLISPFRHLPRVCHHPSAKCACWRQKVFPPLRPLTQTMCEMNPLSIVYSRLFREMRDSSVSRSAVGGRRGRLQRLTQHSDFRQKKKKAKKMDQLVAFKEKKSDCFCFLFLKQELHLLFYILVQIN